MKNELVIPAGDSINALQLREIQEFIEAHPDDFKEICSAAVRWENLKTGIQTWDDYENAFLRGRGLSRTTYRTYSFAAKEFFEFTGRLWVEQVKPAHIERYHDHLIDRGIELDTAALRIRALKAVFRGVEEWIWRQKPNSAEYKSPFECMTQKLRQKLSKTRKGNRKKKAMTKDEFNALRKWLKGQDGHKARCNYAIVYFLAGSGLRASELLQLRWKNLSYFEGTWTAEFTGKGDKEAEQELFAPAVEATQEYFRLQFKRDPRPEDHLFYTVPGFPGDALRPMPYHTLHRRIQDLGKAAMEAGIIKRDLIFSPHLFRRTYTTILDKEGMGLVAIQGKSRHSSIETLVKHYIDDEEKASPYLDRAFGEETAQQGVTV